MITLISGGIELEAKLLIKRGKDLKCASAERKDLIIKKQKKPTRRESSAGFPVVN
jgi:hypothetical protein